MSRSVLENPAGQIGPIRQNDEIQVVDFILGINRFAIDITKVKEIVEYKTVTPLPKTPPYVKGIIDLRGEITTIIDIRLCLNLTAAEDESAQKRIIILDSASNRQKTGIVVDNVLSVLPVDPAMIDESVHQEVDGSGHIRGIIKHTGSESQNGKKELIIWIDVDQILSSR